MVAHIYWISKHVYSPNYASPPNIINYDSLSPYFQDFLVYIGMFTTGGSYDTQQACWN